jgi:predicted MFS family arabinose efflux permease
MSRALLTISLIAFGCTLFTRSVDPVIPQIASSLDVLPTTAALLSTAFALPYAVVQPILGAVADVFGKARLMLLCLAIGVVACFLSAFAFSFPQLVAARMLAGAVSGGVFPAAVAIVGDLVPIAQRQVAISRVVAAGMLGNLLSATIAGVVGDLWDWRGAFIITGLIAAITLAPSRQLLQMHEPERATGPAVTLAMRNFRAIFANPLAKVCFGAVFLDALVIFGLFPYTATILEQQGETSATIAGVIIAGFGVGAIVYSVIVQRLLVLFDARALMLVGGVVMAACLMVVPLGPAWPFQIVNFLIMGVAFFLLHGGIQVFVTELAPAARGSAMALHSSSFFFGQAAGPIFYGLGFAHLGMLATFVIAAIVIAGVGAWSAATLRHGKSMQV